MIEFRRMQKKDVVQVAQMEKEYFSEPWSEQAFLEVLDKKEYLYMVAAQGEEILAYCGMYRVLDEGNITQVAVRSDMRRRGIARDLLQDFMQNGKLNGADAYTLEVRVSNQSAICLYEACGFVKESVRKNFYAAPTEDAFIMWKR